MSKLNVVVKTIGYAIGGFIIFLIVYSLLFILIRNNDEFLSDFFDVVMPLSIFLGALIGLKKLNVNIIYMLKQILKYSFYGIILAFILFNFYFFTYGIFDASNIYLFIVGLGAIIGFIKGFDSDGSSENRPYYGYVIDIAVTTIKYMIGGFIFALLLFFIITSGMKAEGSINAAMILPFYLFVFTGLGALIGLSKKRIAKKTIRYAIYGLVFAILLSFILDSLTSFAPVFTGLGALIGLIKGLQKENEVRGKYETIEAIECYDKALKLNPNDEEAWYNKGSALSKIGKYDEAIECYDKALKLNPNKEEAWYNCACAYSIKGNIEKAIYNLTKAIDIDASFKEKANADKDFEKLRDDDAFKKLIS